MIAGYRFLAIYNNAKLAHHAAFPGIFTCVTYKAHIYKINNVQGGK
jgi:hypothetical protein